MSDRSLLEEDISINLDGVSELTPAVTELALEIEQARLEAGLSIEEPLKDLREQRDRYYRETWAADQPE